MQPIPIPQHVDSQQQFFIYELDEALLFFGCFGIGTQIGGWGLLLMILIGHQVVKRFQRYKNGQMDGILLHLVFWNGFLSLNDRYTDGLERETFL